MNHVHMHRDGCDHAIPKTMQACRYNGKRQNLSVDTVNVPSIGDDDALVRVVASGICRSDWHSWNGDFNWLGMEVAEKTVLGHEIGGVIVKIGAGVKHVQPGMRITVPFNMACGYCEYCRQGAQNLCSNAIFAAYTDGAGGWQEYIRVPLADLNCVPLPANVDEITAAALGCRYMTAWRAVTERARVVGGEFVAVHGCGGVGLAAVQVSAALGGRPIAVDIDDEKLAVAKANGAFATVNAKGMDPAAVGAAVKQVAGGAGAQVAIDALGGARTTIGGLLSLRKGGRLAQVGMSNVTDQGLVNIPIDLLVLQELSIVGSWGNPQSAFPKLLELVSAGKLTPKSLVSREVALHEVQDVINDMDQFKTNGYVLITKF